MFMKELKLYINYLNEEIEAEAGTPSQNRLKYYESFCHNIADGIEYYRGLFSSSNKKIFNLNFRILKDLEMLEQEFDGVKQKIIARGFISVDNHKLAAVD